MNYSKMTPEGIAEEYIKLATEEGQCKLDGNYRRGNYLTKKIVKLVDSIKENPQLFKSVIKLTMAAENRRARSMGAVDVLQNNIAEFEEEAVQILEETSKAKDILGFSSKMALSIWRGEFPGDPNTWKKREDTSGK